MPFRYQSLLLFQQQKLIFLDAHTTLHLKVTRFTLEELFFDFLLPHLRKTKHNKCKFESFNQDALACAVALEQQKIYKDELGPEPVPLIVPGEAIPEEDVSLSFFYLTFVLDYSLNMLVSNCCLQKYYISDVGYVTLQAVFCS